MINEREGPSALNKKNGLQKYDFENSMFSITCATSNKAKYTFCVNVLPGLPKNSTFLSLKPLQINQINFKTCSQTLP